MSTVSLRKVSLEKHGQSVSLRKPTTDPILINLNWNQGPAKAGGGLLGRLLGGAQQAKSIDLDLGCLYEMQDGNKGAVQALGDTMGDYNHFPFIELSGDDRTGQNADGETIRINGAHFDKIKRVLVYAFIYAGAPNWDATDGVVTVNVPGEDPIEVRMTGGRNDRAMCGICLIENRDGQMKVTRTVDYFPSHSQLDLAHHWGMSWVPGRKD